MPILLIYFSLVYHSHSLAFANRKAAFRHEFYMRREENFVLQATLDFFLQGEETCEVVGEEFFEFYFYSHVIVVLVSGQRDEVVVGKFLELHENLLNLNREDVHAAQYHHVIASSAHTVDAHMIASAWTGVTQYTGQVASAVAKQWHRFTA